MSAGDVAGLIAAIAFVLLVGALAVPLVKLGSLIDEARITVRNLSNETTPLIAGVTTTVEQTNAQLGKVDVITTNVASTTTNVSALTALFAATRPAPTALTAPLPGPVFQRRSQPSFPLRSRNRHLERAILLHIRRSSRAVVVPPPPPFSQPIDGLRKPRRLPTSEAEIVASLSPVRALPRRLRRTRHRTTRHLGAESFFDPSSAA